MEKNKCFIRSFELQTLKVDHGLSFFNKLSAQLKVLHDVCSWTTISYNNGFSINYATAYVICSIYSISKPFLIQSVTLNCVKNPTLELNMLKRIHPTFTSYFFFGNWLFRLQDFILFNYKFSVHRHFKSL